MKDRIKCKNCKGGGKVWEVCRNCAGKGVVGTRHKPKMCPTCEPFAPDGATHGAGQCLAECPECKGSCFEPETN